MTTPAPRRNSFLALPGTVRESARCSDTRQRPHPSTGSGRTGRRRIRVGDGGLMQARASQGGSPNRPYVRPPHPVLFVIQLATWLGPFVLNSSKDASAVPLPDEANNE